MRNKYFLRISILPLVLLFTVVIAAMAEAKEGFYLGAEMVFVDIGGTVNPGDTIASGDGAGVVAGYGIGRYVAFEASVQKTVHPVSGGGQTNFKAGMIGVKALLPLAESNLEPFIALGVGKYSLDTRKGDGWWFGAGLDIRLSHSFSLTVGATRHFMDLDPAAKVSGDVTSMDVGIAYHFL
jgi:hypothetical protein